MRKKLIALLGAGLLATGCANVVGAEPTPTPTTDPNVAACADFADTFIAGIQTKPEYLADWEETRDAIDTISLDAEGDVKERMQALVDDWPDMLKVFIWNELDETNEALASIERACTASGRTINVQLATVD